MIDASNTFYKQLFDATEAVGSASLCVLVDPLLRDPFVHDDKSIQKVILPIKPELIKKQHCPYLLGIGDFGRDEMLSKTIDISLREILRAAEDKPYGRTVCAWVISDKDDGAVSSHLARQALITVNSNVQLFRFWDPRVLDLLESSLRPEQICNLLGPISFLSWLGRDGSMRMMTQSSQYANSSKTKLTLDSSQIKLMSYSECINRTLDVLQDMSHPNMDEKLIAKISRQILRGVIDWDLKTDFECVTYALYCNLVNDGFDRVAEVYESMNNAKTESKSPISALDTFDENYWNALKSRLDMNVADRKIGDMRHG